MNRTVAERVRVEAWDASVWAECASKGWKRDDILSICKHMIGIPNKKPYIRHGKLYYKPSRNFFAGKNELLDYLAEKGLDLAAKFQEPGGGQYYMLTKTGLNWLGRQIGIIIYTEED